jgi:hypothetical protein
MEFISAALPKLLSMILSWLDAGNLRNKVYDLQEKLELATVALEDISRIEEMDLIKNVARVTLDKIQ